MALALALPGHAAESGVSPAEIVATAPAAAWVTIAPKDLLVMDLAPDAAGKGRQVVIQLMPAPFARGWVGNIRKLAAAHWWDGMAITRVQDNYVVQWGDPDAEDAAKAKPLPKDLAVMGEGDYVVAGAPPSRGPEKDAYAAATGFYAGWPIAYDKEGQWPVHCYAMVGVGRNLSPDTGTGAELYTVIGHAPRHLDRNIALAGRVISGIEHLSSLPRGTGALGFYEDPAERTMIRQIRMGSDLPQAEQPQLQYLSTESASFTRYADARANRRDAFFIRPAGGADICNIPVPVRVTPQ